MVRVAAAARWPWRRRSRTGRPRRVAERKPAAKASPAPTAATTSTCTARTNVAVPSASSHRPSVSLSKATAPPLPCLTTTISGSGRASRTARAPCSPHAWRASSSPTKTMSALRASSSSTSGSWPSPHRPGRWFTSKEINGRPGRGPVSSRIRARQSCDNAAVMPDRCSTRPARTASRSTPWRHRRRRRARPVVGDLVRVARAVARRAEVDARGAGRVAADVRHVDAVRADRLDEVVAEAVRADAADPACGVAAAASVQATLDSAPPIDRWKAGTSARRPGRDGRNVTMDSPSATTSTTSGALPVPVTVTMAGLLVGAGDAVSVDRVWRRC